MAITLFFKRFYVSCFLSELKIGDVIIRSNTIQIRSRICVAVALCVTGLHQCVQNIAEGRDSVVDALLVHKQDHKLPLLVVKQCMLMEVGKDTVWVEVEVEVKDKLACFAMDVDMRTRTERVLDDEGEHVFVCEVHVGDSTEHWRVLWDVCATVDFFHVDSVCVKKFTQKNRHAAKGAECAHHAPEIATLYVVLCVDRVEHKIDDLVVRGAQLLTTNCDDGLHQLHKLLIVVHRAVAVAELSRSTSHKKGNKDVNETILLCSLTTANGVRLHRGSVCLLQASCEQVLDSAVLETVCWRHMATLDGLKSTRGVPYETVAVVALVICEPLCVVTIRYFLRLEEFLGAQQMTRLQLHVELHQVCVHTVHHTVVFVGSLDG